MSYCIVYLYIGSASFDFCIGILYIVSINYKSITITGGCDGMVYVVDSNIRCFLIICFHFNHIGRAAAGLDMDFSNICRFTQYAASCE